MDQFDSAPTPHSPWRITTVVIGLVLALFVMLVTERVGRLAQHEVQELIADVIDRADAPLRPQDNGLLVRVSGALTADGPLRDPRTGFTADAVAMQRIVQAWYAIDLPRASDGTSRRWNEWLDVVQPERSPRGAPGGLLNETLRHPSARLGAAPLDPSLVPRPGFFGSRAVAAQELLPVLAARFPDRTVTIDGDWVVLAQAPDAPREGDVRLRYRVLPSGVTFTAVGEQDAERLYPARTPWDGPIAGQRRTQDFLPIALIERGAEWRLAGRIVGGLLVIAVVAAAALWGARNDHGLASAMQWEPLALLILLPFALLAAPLVLATIVLSWWMSQGPMQAAIGGSVSLGLATLAVWLAFRQRAEA